MASELSLAWFTWINLARKLRTLLALRGTGMVISAFAALFSFSRKLRLEWLCLYEGTGTHIAAVQKTFLNTSVDESADLRLGLPRGQIVLKETKYDARICGFFKRSPGAAVRTRYAEVQTWLDEGISHPVYVEKTRKATGAVKKFTYFGLRQYSGICPAIHIQSKILDWSDSADYRPRQYQGKFRPQGLQP
jgi:hypothetical protein